MDLPVEAAAMVDLPVEAREVTEVIIIELVIFLLNFSYLTFRAYSTKFTQFLKLSSINHHFICPLELCNRFYDLNVRVI